MKLREKLLAIAKRVISQVLAVLSILFPHLLLIRKSKAKKSVHYTSLFDKIPAKESEGDLELAECEDLADLVVTMDPVTTGFRQDLLLII